VERLLPVSYLLSYTDVATTLVSQILGEDEAHASLYIEHTRKKPLLRGICSDLSQEGTNVMDLLAYDSEYKSNVV